MSRVVGLAILVVFVCLPAAASNPGQPLDCSDWVFSEPGYTCSPWVSYPCTVAFCGGGDLRLIDNSRNLYFIRTAFNDDDPTCPGERIEILKFDGNAQTLFATLGPRCGSGYKDIAFDNGGMFFDEETGVLLVPARVKGYDLPNPTYEGTWIAAIAGFAGEFEVLQSCSVHLRMSA